MKLNNLYFATALRNGDDDLNASTLASSLRRRCVLRISAEPVHALCFAEDGETVCTASATSLRVWSSSSQRQLRLASGFRLRLSSCVQLRGLDILCVGSWDSNIYVYSVGRGRVMEAVAAEQGAVSDLSLGEGGLLSAGNVTSRPSSYGNSAIPLVLSGRLGRLAKDVGAHSGRCAPPAVDS